MSLEQAIQENTKAMQEFATALRAQTELLTQVHSATLSNTAVAPKPNTEAASKAADKVVAETEKKVEKLQGDAKPEGDTEKAYTIEDAKQMTNKAVANGWRDEMVALLKEFGVGQAVKLSEEQVPSFCKKAEPFQVKKALTEGTAS